MLPYLIISFLLVSFTVEGTLRAATQPHAVRPSQPSEASIHRPRSIDAELNHLTKQLELTPKQRNQIRPLLEEHHNKIQALLDKNPTLSRTDLQPQIHAISDETHRQIEALLTRHQKELAKAMQKRMHDGEEHRQSVPSAVPLAARPSETNVVWTNEDLERLSSVPGLISVVGQPINEAAEEANGEPAPQSVTQDPTWYAEQAEQLRTQLESQEAYLRDFIQALENVRELKTPSSGFNFDADDVGMTPDETIDILQSQISETQSQLDDLEDLARQNNIPPGVLRGDWQGVPAEAEAPAEDSAVPAAEASQRDMSAPHGGDL